MNGHARLTRLFGATIAALTVLVTVVALGMTPAAGASLGVTDPVVPYQTAPATPTMPPARLTVEYPSDAPAYSYSGGTETPVATNPDQYVIPHGGQRTLAAATDGTWSSCTSTGTFNGYPTCSVTMVAPRTVTFATPAP